MRTYEPTSNIVSIRGWFIVIVSIRHRLGVSLLMQQSPYSIDLCTKAKSIDIDPENIAKMYLVVNNDKDKIYIHK